MEKGGFEDCGRGRYDDACSLSASNFCLWKSLTVAAVFLHESGRIRGLRNEKLANQNRRTPLLSAQGTIPTASMSPPGPLLLRRPHPDVRVPGRVDENV